MPVESVLVGVERPEHVHRRLCGHCSVARALLLGADAHESGFFAWAAEAAVFGMERVVGRVYKTNTNAFDYAMSRWFP